MPSSPKISCKGVVEPNSTHEASIILLHGLDDDAQYWQHFYKQLKRSNYQTSGIRWIPIQAPKRRVWGCLMNAWFEYYTARCGEKLEDDINERHVIETRKALHSVCQAEAQSLRNAGGSRKILLIGSSQGGSVALDAALTLPEQHRLGGVVILRGLALGSTVKALASSRSPVTPTPVLAVSGVNDKTFALPLVRQQLQMVQEAMTLSHEVLPSLSHDKDYDPRETSLTIEFVSKQLQLQLLHNSPVAAICGRHKCPGGCGMSVTWHPTHCCNMCKQRGGGCHGFRCDRLPFLESPDAEPGQKQGRKRKSSPETHEVSENGKVQRGTKALIEVAPTKAKRLKVS